ncbi:MAG TPA: hypothetical protein VGD88_04465 [Opitutaceae bacterium]
MKLTQKRLGSSVAFEVDDQNLVVTAKSFGAKGRAKIPLVFIADEYSEQQERSRGWIAISVLCGILAVVFLIGGLSTEKEARDPILGMAIISGVIAALAVRSHRQRNVDGVVFVRTDTSDVIFLHRDNPSHAEFEAFLQHLLSAIHDRKKKADPVGTDNSGAAPRRV